VAGRWPRRRAMPIRLISSRPPIIGRARQQAAGSASAHSPPRP
jgi:hypothetical protein